MNDRFSDPRHKKWAKAVKARDNFTCQICGKQGVYLNSHHIYSYDTYEDKRFDIDNGITLCSYHHEIFHSIYGAGNNTGIQFKEYVNMLRIIKKIAAKNFKYK